MKTVFGRLCKRLAGRDVWKTFSQGIYLDGAHNPMPIHRLVEYARTFQISA